MRSFFRWLRLYGLAVYWVILLGLMYLETIDNLPIPTDAEGAAFAQNFEDDLSRNVFASLIEITCLYLILRPWSFTQSVGRVVGTLVLVLLWTSALFYVALNAGRVSNVLKIHLLWLVVLNLGLVAILIWRVGKFLWRSLQQSRQR
ncbi:hypothetical protein H6F93_19325 [Leptolyngbya sp. FACHB-671]|uniref:hypothetical protein n=1 Tax=Leptolyngbya sp. FACHB-671 TaxID=2692812 RepID=UPI00168907DD|nr:hypothetical protein [Leptolyngbya sp. FACHB-671]MBD2069647.1 hypothetical protein [Leptolyngbya sp. FACHB-671]